MKSHLLWLTCFALAGAAAAWAGGKPVAYRLASLPASADPGQNLVLCAANIGTGALDVTLELIDVKTGARIADKTVTLAPLGSGAAAQPCLTTTIAPPSATPASVPMSSSFAPSAATPAADGGQALIVGVAMVRKPLLSFRVAQVTASIQVLAPDGSGAMRTVATIPLSRIAHPSDGAPVYAPPADSGHRK